MTFTSAAWPEGDIEKFLVNGQGYMASPAAGLVTGANSLTVCGLSLFNPASSGKNILIFSIQPLCSRSSVQNQLRATTTDPSGTTGFTNTSIVPANLLVAGAASIASVSSSANNIASIPAAPGTLMGAFGSRGAAFIEILTHRTVIVLPPGNGLAVMIYAAASGENFGCLAKWIEY